MAVLPTSSTLLRSSWLNGDVSCGLAKLRPVLVAVDEAHC